MRTHPLFTIAELGVSLRWRLATNRLRRRGKKTRRILIGFAAAYVIFNVVFLGAARFATDESAGNALILLMTSMAFGWVFGPVLIGGVDETIDPTRLALLPLSTAERYTMQLAAAMTGAGPLAATTGLLLGLTIGHINFGVAILIVPLAAMSAVLLMVGSARALAALLAIAQRSRVGRDLSVLAAAMAGGVLFTMAQLARDVVGSDNQTLVNAMGWLPWGWPARSINAAHTHHAAAAVGWLILTIAATVVVHLGWARLSTFLLVNGERAAQSKRRRSGSVLNGATTTFGASLSRQWIYLRRSPNSRVGFLFGLVFGIAFAMVQIVQQGAGSGGAAAFGILLAMLANLGAATNVLGFDAGSLWLEVLAGGPGRVHMLARQLIALPNLLLPTWVSGIVVSVWTGEWRLVLLVCMLAISVAVNVLSFGVIASAVWPAALPDWDNPFGNRNGNESRGLRLMIIAGGGLTTIIVLSAPIFVTTFKVLDRWWVWLVPFGGVAFASVILALAIEWVGRYLSGREPDLVEALSPRALN